MSATYPGLCDHRCHPPCRPQSFTVGSASTAPPGGPRHFLGLGALVTLHLARPFAVAVSVSSPNLGLCSSPEARPSPVPSQRPVCIGHTCPESPFSRPEAGHPGSLVLAKHVFSQGLSLLLCPVALKLTCTVVTGTKRGHFQRHL